MTKMFNPGNRVSLVDENISGNVVSVDGNNVSIITDDGFQLTFQKQALIVEDSELLKNMSQAANANDPEWREKHKSVSTPINLKTKNNRQGPMEVDLHIHHLTASTRGMSNYDMLTLQIETAKKRLEFAIQKKISSVVFIHGVGQGVLREELKFLFGHYSGLRYFDASYSNYGLGATQVEISSNAKLI